MTELAPLTTHAEHQLGSATAFTPSSHSANGYSPEADAGNDDEDSSVIKCICGYSDDDGRTVLCELCNSWQHVQCYYPRRPVPEVHECADCRPTRDLDVKRAKEHQRQIRLSSLSGLSKGKRVPGKSHKKKTKDANQVAVQSNGWPVPEQAQVGDRTSGSPRDHPPPAKRPKTSHRTSSSTSALHPLSLPAQSRKRAGSTTIAGQSPTKSSYSPPAPNGYIGDYYSPEFMRLQRKPAYSPVQNNSYAKIDVSNDLRTWLNDVEALKEVTNGLTQQNVFHRWDKPIEELEQTSPGFTMHKQVDSSIKIQGEHPVMQWLTADAAASGEAYIGELKGAIGKIEDYYDDPSNRWAELNHPTPFVFFHDKLPIFIDCREEGTELRYLRRSCQPNVKMQIIIHSNDFHFCMVSMRDIAEGEELTIPWHIRGREWEIMRALNSSGNLSREDHTHMSTWFTGVLANFGGCACARTGSVCSLDRFDLRSNTHASGTNGHSLKPFKSRKHKKGAAHISPLSTGRATNSRAGSEAVLHGDMEDDLVDSRSVSNSSRSKPSSRDITPMGNMSDGPPGLGVEMSDRERRKLQQQERLFEKMEQGENGNRKKRNSAGSALNTPSLSTSVRITSKDRRDYFANRDAQKQLGFPDSQNPSPTSASSSSRPRVNGQSASRPGPNGALAQRPRARPVYKEIATQTEMEEEETPTEQTLLRRAQGSLMQRQLRMIHEERRRRQARSLSIASQEPASPPPPAIQAKVEPVGSPKDVLMPPPPLPSHHASGPTPQSPSEQNDSSHDVTMEDSAAPAPVVSLQTSVNGISDEPPEVEMKDAPDSATHFTSSPDDEKKDSLMDSPPTPKPESPLSSSNTPMPPPAPPWPVDAPPPSEKSPSPRPVGLHVQLPPVPTFFTQPSIQTPTTPSEAVTLGASITGTTVTQSPPVLTVKPPLFSPTTASVVAPSPMKKKLSLGEYTRRKNEAIAQAQAQQLSSPLSATGSASAATANHHASSSPTEERPAALDETPSLQQSNSSVIEEVDMPLAPIVLSEPVDSDPTVGATTTSSTS
jgi:hypothetical protein